MRYRLLSLAIAGAAAAVVLPAGMAAAAPGAAATRPAAACSWRLDTRLPIPTGMAEATITATDGVADFAGIAANRSVDDLFHAVVWRGGRVSLLPTPLGAGSMAFGMNRRGDVVGVIQPADFGPSQPVLWRDGQVIRLGVAAPDISANPRDINDAGLIVGEAFVPSEDNRAIAWSADTPSKFSYVAAPAIPSFLTAATEADLVAGSYTGTATGGFIPSVPAVGTVAAGLHPIGLPAGANSGQVVAAGGAYLAGTTSLTGEIEAHATIWQGEMPELLSKEDSVAVGVNAQGTAIGYKTATLGRALVWTAGVEQALPILSPGPSITSASAMVITDGNAIGGSVTSTTSASRPVVWHCR
ncbi:MAG TPA: hypothetical protein VMU51_20110 [Mycobacteriales bacterium]|nr:hypothetical protein [Mycobacteriales bacterium]